MVYQSNVGGLPSLGPILGGDVSRWRRQAALQAGGGGEQINGAARAAPPAEADRLEGGIQHICQAAYPGGLLDGQAIDPFRNVKKGDSHLGLYLPGKGWKGTASIGLR